MSNGAFRIPQTRRKNMGNPSPFQSRQDSALVRNLAIETDHRLFKSIFSSGGVWIGLLAFIATLPPPRIEAGYGRIPETVIPDVEDTTRVTWVPPLTYKPKMKVTKRTSPPKSGQAQVSSHPSKESGVLNTKVISANSNILGKSAYEILSNTLRDLPKLESFGVIHRDGNTRIANGRKGRQSTGYNEGYGINDGDGNWDMTGYEPTLARIKPEIPEPPKPNLSLREHSISHTQSEGWRSTASIWAVVKSHSPGLRHLYNQHLRTHPGLQGKVSVRFGIDARGTVVSAEIEGSTTGSERFDQAIL
jgi:hypothetical protein